METGEPGVKPPEPVIDVWRHQCLTHKVATSSCSVFLVNLCLLLVTNQVSSCKTGGIANQLIKPEIDMNAWIHRWGSSTFPFPCLRSLVGKFWCLHHDEIVSFVITPMLYWHGKPGLKSRLRSRKKHWKSYWRKPMLRRRTKILGPKELARINVQDHTTQEDVFFDYDPSSAPSLLSIWQLLLT